MKTALVTGITGQDGSYLAEFLLDKGYIVHAIVRRNSTPNFQRIQHLLNNKKLVLHNADLSDVSSMTSVLCSVKPAEIYNLAAHSHVRISFDLPEYTADTAALGCLRILDIIHKCKLKTKFYQACSSEMFGKVVETPQKESTPFYPRSPYGCSKVFSYWITKNYRESYGIFACNGILFNHESPRRGEEFVTKKITKGLSRIKLGKQQTLYLGNLDAKRDWGYAKDYVEGMWLMLQKPEPDDYVLATGETHSVRELIHEACNLLGINIKWRGKGVNEKGINVKTGKVIISIDPILFRPAEVDILLGDYSKAKTELGWKPKTTFKKLVKLMIQNDLKNEG